MIQNASQAVDMRWNFAVDFLRPTTVIGFWLNLHHCAQRRQSPVAFGKGLLSFRIISSSRLSNPRDNAFLKGRVCGEECHFVDYVFANSTWPAICRPFTDAPCVQ